jgi:hypothetical protein
VSKVPLKDRHHALNTYIKKNTLGCRNIEVIFIPRTIYELFYFLSDCEFRMQMKKRGEEVPENPIQHIKYVDTQEKELSASLVCTAFALNQYIIRQLNLVDTGLTIAQFQRAGKGILDRLKELHQIAPDIVSFLLSGKVITPLHLDQIIALECNSANHIILYRGSRFKNEPLYENGSPYAPSFGLSLFAGWTYDSYACAASRIFLETDTQCGYALRISLNTHWQDTFDIPSITTLCGLLGRGELFHARAKCVTTVTSISGYAGEATFEIQERLVSSLEKDALEKELSVYQAQRILIPLPRRIERAHLKAAKLLENLKDGFYAIEYAMLSISTARSYLKSYIERYKSKTELLEDEFADIGPFLPKRISIPKLAEQYESLQLLSCLNEIIKSL